MIKSCTWKGEGQSNQYVFDSDFLPHVADVASEKVNVDGITPPPQLSRVTFFKVAPERPRAAMQEKPPNSLPACENQIECLFGRLCGTLRGTDGAGQATANPCM